jgi:hypothetical protein
MAHELCYAGVILDDEEMEMSKDEFNKSESVVDSALRGPVSIMSRP